MKKELPDRKWLRHETPHWVGSNATFFLTICSATRGGDDLIDGETPRQILDSAKFYHDQKKWWVSMILIMPDHLHILVQFPFDAEMKTVIKNWKRYLARSVGVKWQDGFFDHRIRNEEGFTEKANYIDLNPVKAGLVTRPEDWKWRGGLHEGW